LFQCLSLLNVEHDRRGNAHQRLPHCNKAPQLTYWLPLTPHYNSVAAESNVARARFG
jgi:hypothetical protein